MKIDCFHSGGSFTFSHTSLHKILIGGMTSSLMAFNNYICKLHPGALLADVKPILPDSREPVVFSSLWGQ
jgi:hypothetical protein